MGELLQCPERAFSITLSDEPPRTLGAEGQRGEDQDGDYPLAGEGNFVAPLVRTGLRSSQDSGRDELAGDIGGVDRRCEYAAEDDGRHF